MEALLEGNDDLSILIISGWRELPLYGAWPR